MKIRPREGEVYFDVVAVVDPVTRDAQKVAPLLLVGSHTVQSTPVHSSPLQSSSVQSKDSVSLLINNSKS